MGTRWRAVPFVAASSARQDAGLLSLARDDPIARGFEPTVELSDRDEPAPTDSHDLEARQDLSEEE